MSLTNGEAKFRVAIIGGGMGGLVVGLCLKKYAPDVHFDIYEAATELTELGAGITMSPRTWSMITELGLGEELLPATGTQAPTGAFPSTVYAYPRPTFPEGDEDPAVQVFQLPQLHSLHRSDIQRVLTKHIGNGDRIHFSKRLTSYSESSHGASEITLHFKDGTTAACDLVIGSDGIRSAVRRTMFNDLAQDDEDRGKTDEAVRMREMMELVYSGHIAYRGLARASALSETAFRHTRTLQPLMGKTAFHMMIFPIAGGKSVNVVATKYIPGHAGVHDGPWVESRNGEAIVEQFEGWQTWALETIMAIDMPSRWAMHTVRELPTYVRHGRVALVGDAAHAMLPYQGAGAGQAFEDGFVLSLILSSPTITATGLGEHISEEDSREGRYPCELLAALAEDIQAERRWVFEVNIDSEDDRAHVAERLAALSS
ncbi:hypothetical protein V8D89_006278 [Ganoderma adspersum]